jgi:hypothetical protein
VSTQLRNIILTIASIRAVVAKRGGGEITLTELLKTVTDEIAHSKGDFSKSFEGITDSDVGGRPVSLIRSELEADYRRAAVKIYRAQVKRRRKAGR